MGPAEEVRSVAGPVAGSAEVKPRPSGEGSGVVERLFKAGLEGGAVVWPGTGREPMGPTEPIGPATGLDWAWREEDESAPGDEVEVTGWSAKPALMAELGEEVLLAREGDCRAVSALAAPGWVRPNGSTPRGDEPRTPEDGVAPPAWLSGRELSSEKAPGGKKAGLSLPYRARCWRARSSRRLSSLTAAGLVERSDLLADISARRP